MPTSPPTEERPLTELGAGAVALAVLGEVGRAGAGGVQARDDRPVRTLRLAVDRHPDPAEGEAGVDRLAEPQVEDRPRTGALRGQPLGALVEVEVLAGLGHLVVALEGGGHRARRQPD